MSPFSWCTGLQHSAVIAWRTATRVRRSSAPSKFPAAAVTATPQAAALQPWSASLAAVCCVRFGVGGGSAASDDGDGDDDVCGDNGREAAFGSTLSVNPSRSFYTKIQYQRIIRGYLGSARSERFWTFLLIIRRLPGDTVVCCCLSKFKRWASGHVPCVAKFEPDFSQIGHGGPRADPRGGMKCHEAA